MSSGLTLLGCLRLPEGGELPRLRPLWSATSPCRRARRMTELANRTLFYLPSPPPIFPYLSINKHTSKLRSINKRNIIAMPTEHSATQEQREGMKFPVTPSAPSFLTSSPFVRARKHVQMHLIPRDVTTTFSEPHVGLRS